MSSQQQADSDKAPWLGLLKWSLNYVDGTVPSSESKNFKAMSEEDKKFLEEVMRNGIVDEGDRMTVILNSLVSYLDSCLNVSKDNDSNENDPDGKTSEKVPSLEEVEEMMMELQDIVEQIDFAKSFASMGGLQFLIGCASASASSAPSTSSSSLVPGSIRAACLGILATLCQNNPAVQMMMLEQGNIPKLIQIYFDQFSTSTSSADGEDSSSAITSKAMQAMSSSVRNHDVAEKIFCMNDDGIKMVETGLGMYSSSSLSIPPPSAALRRRALFFLQALITSDTADGDRVRLFKAAIQFVAGRYLDLNTGIDGAMVENDSQTREMGLSMITRILDQKNSVDALTEKGVHSFLVSLGVRRVSNMRSILDVDEKEMVAEELKLWEEVMSRLSKAQ